MVATEGKFVAIQGTSGSGKSTLLNLLGGLDQPTTGDVFFDSQPLGPLTKKQMARYRRFSVGMIFPNFNLIPTMTASENVKLALAFGGMRGVERRERTASLLSALAWRVAWTIVLPKCRVASSNAWPSRARWRINRVFCLPTNRPGI
jgi:putative ABC transport system ATP-binding protein